MKRLFFIIIIISLTFISCNTGNSYSGKLKRAEMIVNDSSKVALNILEKEIDPEALTKDQYADWCLLLTKARDKQYVVHESDSLINIAVRYYQSKRSVDPDKMMDAYYYMGRVSQDTGNGLRAQDYYLKALDVGKNTKDRRVLVLINNFLAMLYVEHEVTEMAVSYYHKALAISEAIKDSLNTSYTYSNIGHIYFKRNEIDSAMVYYEKALANSIPATRFNALNGLAGVYTAKEDFEQALIYLDECIKIEPRSKDWLYSNKSLCFYNAHEFDSARVYADYGIQSTDWHTREKAKYVLYKLAKRDKQWVDALTFLEEYKTYTDSVAILNNTESLRRTEKMYNYRRTENELNKVYIEKLNAESDKYKLFLVVVILSLIVVVSYFHSQRRRHKMEVEQRKMKELFERIHNENDLIIRRNAERIDELEAQLAEKVEREQALVESNIKKLVLENQQLANAQYQCELMAGKFRETTIYKQLHSPKPWTMNESEKKELYIQITKAFPAFFHSLRYYYPKIKDDEIYMCALIKAELKQLKTVAMHMNLTPQAIAMKRDRLYVKIFKSGGGKKTFEDFIKKL